MIRTSLTLVIALQTTPPISSPAEPLESPSGWFSTDDYPKDALDRGAQGAVRFRLSVGRNGRADACAVEESSGDVSLDQTTCAIATERGRFRPARNEAGESVEGTYSTRIRWALPTAPYLIGLEPVRVVNMLTARFGDAVRCETVSATNPANANFGCNMEYNHFEVWAYARNHRGREVRLSDSIAFTSGDLPFPPSQEADLGERYASREVRLTVSSGAVVTNCEIVQSAGRAPRGLTMTDICDYYRENGRAMFAPISTPAGERTLRVTHDYYLQISDGRVDPKPD